MSYRNGETIITNIKPVPKKTYEKYFKELRWITTSYIKWCGLCQTQFKETITGGFLRRPCCEIRIKKEKEAVNKSIEDGTWSVHYSDHSDNTDDFRKDNPGLVVGVLKK